MTRHLTTLMIFALAAGCTATEQKKTSNRTPAGSTPPTPTTTVAGCTDANAAALPTAGTLVFRFTPAEVDPCSIAMAVVGDDGATAHTMHVMPDNSIMMDGLSDSSSDMIVTGQVALATGLTQATTKVGLRLKAVTTSAAARTDLNVLELLPLGSISGKATLTGQTDHTGIDVYVPGTSFVAKTDATGTYKISDVPAGEHNLQFEKFLYHPAQVGQVTVATLADTSVDAVALFQDVGDASAIGLIPAATTAAPATTLTVQYAVYPKGHPVLMKVGENANFPNQEAKPFVSSGSFTFAIDDALKAGGKATRKLYVQLVENGVTSLLEREVVIDLFHGQSLTVTNPQVLVDDAKVFHFTDIVPPTLPATSMSFATKADFSDARTVAVAATYDWTFADDLSTFCGAHQIYFKILLTNGVVSPVLTKAIEYRCAQAMSTTGAPFDRGFAQTLFNGSDFIVYGGSYGLYSYIEGGGAIYNLAADKWQPMPPLPSGMVARTLAFTGWNGTQWFVWGGSDGNTDLNDGAIYVPGSVGTGVRGTWTKMESANAPIAREEAFAAVLADGRFLIWGGQINGSSYADTNTGAIYDPNGATGSKWHVISQTNAPDLYNEATVAFVNNRLIVWSGDSHTPPYRTGGKVYDPATGLWTTMASANELAGRIYSSHAVVGNELFVWGGQDPTDVIFLNAAFFNPATNEWRAATPNTIGLSRSHYTFSSGGKVFTFGGDDSEGNYYVLKGTLFKPTAASGAGSWSAVSMTGATPDVNINDYTMVNTGDKIAMWVEPFNSTAYDDTSLWLKLFDPATNTWSDLSDSGPNANRGGTTDYDVVPKLYYADHKLIVWGGRDRDDDGDEPWRKDGTIYFLKTPAP